MPKRLYFDKLIFKKLIYTGLFWGLQQEAVHFYLKIREKQISFLLNEEYNFYLTKG